MIIVNMMGGLGNQMFQYAAARHLAVIHNTRLKIDASHFYKQTANKEHTFQLNCLNITSPQALGDEVSEYRPPGSTYRRIVNRIRKTLKLPVTEMANPHLYSEPDGSSFKPEVLELGPDVYLVGYFNSYKYFEPITDIIIGEYTPKEGIGAEARDISESIDASNSIGIHIRRGDYVDDPNVREGVEGIITERYYRNAIEFLSERVAAPHFFVFSNDMDWVKTHFKIPFRTTYVDINPPKRGYEDLWIMSRCKHNITAGGSTFSWWAAYLNPNPDKVIVRTENVSNDPAYNHPEDYFPPEWKTVKS
jgi:hypothetical protein